MQARGAGVQGEGAQGERDHSQESEPSAQAVISSRVHTLGTGLEIAGPGAQKLAFGQERAVVEQAVVSRMGEPVSRLANQECGAGPMQFTSFAGGLTLNFQDGAFAGWALERSEEDKGFATARA